MRIVQNRNPCFAELHGVEHTPGFLGAQFYHASAGLDAVQQASVFRFIKQNTVARLQPKTHVIERNLLQLALCQVVPNLHFFAWLSPTFCGFEGVPASQTLFKSVWRSRLDGSLRSGKRKTAG
jgi:hypothetical protein